MKKIRVVIVTWWDAVANTGWASQQDVNDMLKDKSHIAYSIGIIVHKDKNYLYLAADFGENAERSYNRTMAIPLPNIRSIRVVR